MNRKLIFCLPLLLAPVLVDGANLTSEVKIQNGMPALYVNGKLTSQVLSAPYRGTEADISDALKAGISTFNIYVRFDWTGPEQYDFARLDARLDTFVKLDPNTRFIGRVLLTPGNWWCTQFPNEITMRDDGSPAGIFDYSPPGLGCHPSLSSEIYRDLSHKAAIALLNHLEEKYGDHFAGYQAGNGFGGEWLMFNSFWETRPGAPPPAKFGVEDYSPPARAGFRHWLQTKYGGIVALRRAWADPKVTFETATPPNEVERYSTTHGIFFDPAVSQRVTDYFSFFNDTVSDVLLENCRWIKEITKRRKIVGAFYGYLWCNFPNLSVVHTGHLGIAKVLRSPDVDFLAGPYTYDNKQIGGPNNSQSLPEAAALHGKLFFSEVDTETHLEQRQWRWGNSLNNPKNWEETKGLLTRDYAYALSKGFGMWWTDLHGGNFHDDQIIKLWSDLRNIDEKYLQADKRSRADIAVVLDEDSFKYFGDGEPLFNALLTAQKQWELGFIGAPWDSHLLTDMDNPKLRDYKLYIFLNTFRVTPEQRAAIHARLKRNNATAVWVYAPGYIGQKLSVADMRDLTGINLTENDSAGELHVDITSYEHPYTKSLAPGFAYGTDVNVANIVRWYDHQIYLKDPRDPGLQRDLAGFRINPRFWSSDPAATVLGKLAGIDKPGLVIKKQPGWTSVYSSAPILPAALIRNIARAAGCHIYSDANDVVYANRKILAVYAPAGGTRTIRLPERAKVVDLLENRTVSEGAPEFSLEMRPNSTVLLALEEPAVFRSNRAAADHELTADPDDSFWKDAKGVALDKDILNNPASAVASEARSRWTDRYLYFLFFGPYETLHLKPDPDTVHETYHLWDWDDFELYLGANFENINLYGEFQISPQSEFLDQAIDAAKPKPGWNDERFWDSGMTVKSRIDVDRKIWYGEMRIPIASIDKRPPMTGNEMRVNVYRLQSAGQGKRIHFLAWQPTGEWNPHRPQKFGVLQLVDER